MAPERDERSRRRPGASGTPIRLADGCEWMLVDVVFRPSPEGLTRPLIDGLLDRDDMTAPEQDYLDVLSDLVEEYEDEHIPIGPVGDADMLRFLIANKGVTQAEAASGAGIAESTISEVLSGKRKLNRGQIGKLARYFRVDPGAFVD